MTRNNGFMAAGFSVAVLLGSFLMFWLEPMAAKIVLPRFGGAPMVWKTCVVFFQFTLLIGYAIVHAVRRLPTRFGVVFTIALAVLASITLPIAIEGDPPASEFPVAWLLWLLARSLGPIFLVLSMVAPALQAWFADSDERLAGDPYFLYAASNAGSFVALLAYLTFIERDFTLGEQRAAWTTGYALLLLMLAIASLTVWRQSARAAVTTSRPDVPGENASSVRGVRAIWFVLAFIPSALMLGVTTYISTDVAAVPLVWVAPLGLYLLTFVIAFGGFGEAVARGAMRRTPVLVTGVLFLFAANVLLPLAFHLVLHLVAFVTICLMCHGMLNQRRPPAQRLTEFYLSISAGGVAAGLFSVLAAPLIFDGASEYPLELLASAAIPLLTLRASRLRLNVTRADLLVPVVLMIAVAVAIVALEGFVGYGRAGVAMFGICALYAYSQARRPVRFVLSLCAMLIASMAATSEYGQLVHARRTFFGTYRVTVKGEGRYRALYHGTTLHGMQSLDHATESEPETYYHRAGPFGQAWAALPAMHDARRVAVIGLGIGSLAGYRGRDQQWSFFEIDPAVETIARNPSYFSFLARCGNACSVIVGDARLSLSHLRSAPFDLLVLDAFSSDAIPVHLITAEAFSEYLSHLTADGVIALHVSNRYLDLGPLLGGLAVRHGLTALAQFQRSVRSSEAQTDSNWVVMARHPEPLAALARDPRWTPLETDARRTLVWTDEYSNVLSVLRHWR